MQLDSSLCPVKVVSNGHRSGIIDLEDLLGIGELGRLVGLNISARMLETSPGRREYEGNLPKTFRVSPPGSVKNRICRRLIVGLTASLGLNP